MIDIDKVPSPCYVMDEKLLRKNLSLIKSVADKAGVEITLFFERKVNDGSLKKKCVVYRMLTLLYAFNF